MKVIPVMQIDPVKYLGKTMIVCLYNGDEVFFKPTGSVQKEPKHKDLMQPLEWVWTGYDVERMNMTIPSETIAYIVVRGH